jgi:OOP family OmpA-OmpF porin
MKNLIKNTPSLILIFFLFAFGQNSEAQFLKKLQKNAKKNTKQVVTQPKEVKAVNNEATIIEESPVKELKPWSKYNFVPGDEIIFEDDLANEENGEFPSRWDLLQGNGENASLGDENIIRLENRSIITPLMDTEKYLPEVFTIEFDAYFEDGPTTWQNYQIRFWNSPHYLSLPNKDVYYAINIQSDGAYTEFKNNGVTKKLRGNDEATVGQLPAWKHIAISFNKRSLKVFVDEYRALNIPNYKLKPELFTIGTYIYVSKGKTVAIKNIRIAKGGKKLYDRIVSDGKFVTRGILFDVNKSSIKPASHGVINKIAKMLKEHADLNFSIEGHTDSDGEASYNQQLSLKRAEAVKKALISAGIAQERLEAKGMGESVPLAENTSAEAKANNRRVEFIKI